MNHTKIHTDIYTDCHTTEGDCIVLSSDALDKPHCDDCYSLCVSLCTLADRIMCMFGTVKAWCASHTGIWNCSPEGLVCVCLEQNFSCLCFTYLKKRNPLIPYWWWFLLWSPSDGFITFVPTHWPGNLNLWTDQAFLSYPGLLCCPTKTDCSNYNSMRRRFQTGCQTIKGRSCYSLILCLFEVIILVKEKKKIIATESTQYIKIQCKINN